MKFVYVFVLKIFLVGAVCDPATHYIALCAVTDRTYKAERKSQFQTDAIPVILV